MNRKIKFRAWIYNKTNPDLVPKMVYQDGIYSNGLPLFGSEFENAETAELMQFTGLKDKNGKEIYEGDIIELAKESSVYDYPYRLLVEWQDNGFNFQSKCSWYVIGNIYENPELKTN